MVGKFVTLISICTSHPMLFQGSLNQRKFSALLLGSASGAHGSTAFFFSSCCCGFPVLVSEISHSAKEISALQKFSPVVDTCHCLISISGILSMLRSGCFSHLPENFYHSPSKWLRRLSCQASLGDLQNPKHQCSEWSLNLRCLHL